MLDDSERVYEGYCFVLHWNGPIRGNLPIVDIWAGVDHACTCQHASRYVTGDSLRAPWRDRTRQKSGATAIVQACEARLQIVRYECIDDSSARVFIATILGFQKVTTRHLGICRSSEEIMGAEC